MEDAGRVDPKSPGKTQTSDGKLRFTSGDLWRLVYIFLIFMVVRFVIEYVLGTVLTFAADYLGDFFIVREDGVPTGFTGNTTTLITAVAFAGGAGAIFTKALKLIRRTADDMRLEHLLYEPRWTYVLMGLATVGSVIGLNLLLELVGFTEKSAAYQAVQEDQYSAVFVLGLLVYGFVTPIAEELVFRGLIYNYLRAFFRTKIALIVAAAFFGLYHMNSVQGMYAFLMGMLMIYAYEYFGSFLAPVLIHVGSNVLSYCLTYTALGSTVFVSWPVCAVALVTAAVCLLVLNRRKVVLH
jgi:membrane protease YdiL (CAAX protease family)